MAKPAAGTSLDAGNALYTGLAAVWAMLAGAGSTSADSTTNGHDLTLDGSVSWTTAGGDPVLAFAGSTGQACAIASPITTLGTASWSLAWRGKQTSNDNNGMVAGAENNPANSFVWMSGSNGEVWVRANSTTTYTFGGGTLSFTTERDWLVVYDQPAGRLHVYRDGVELAGSPATVAGNDAAMTWRSIGSGYDGAGTLSLIGQLEYVYLWAARALDGTDAGTIHAAPYGFFSAGGGGFDAATLPRFEWPQPDRWPTKVLAY